MYACKGDINKFNSRQTFRLRNHRDISVENSLSECLDLSKGKIIVYNCKFQQGNQYFRYDLDTKQIFCGRKRSQKCIDMDPSTNMIVVSTCDVSKNTQRWTWGAVNETMLKNWVDYGKPILDAFELDDLKQISKV